MTIAQGASIERVLKLLIFELEKSANLQHTSLTQFTICLSVMRALRRWALVLDIQVHTAASAIGAAQVACAISAIWHAPPEPQRTILGVPTCPSSWQLRPTPRCEAQPLSGTRTGLLDPPCPARSSNTPTPRNFAGTAKVKPVSSDKLEATRMSYDMTPDLILARRNEATRLWRSIGNDGSNLGTNPTETHLQANEQGARALRRAAGIHIVQLPRHLARSLDKFKKVQNVMSVTIKTATATADLDETQHQQLATMSMRYHTAADAASNLLGHMLACAQHCNGVNVNAITLPTGCNAMRTLAARSAFCPAPWHTSQIDLPKHTPTLTLPSRSWPLQQQ